MILRVLLLSAGLAAASLPAAGQPGAAAERALACARLRADAGAQRGLPGALAALCDDPARLEAQCRGRSGAACTADAACERSYGSPQCQRSTGPCPPNIEYLGCRPASFRWLDRVGRQHAACLRSGGRWTVPPGGGGAARYGVTCVCEAAGTATPAASAVAGDGRRLYIEDRGCVSETALCREHRGVWTTQLPPGFGSGPAPRPYCRIGDQGAAWGTLEPAGFPQ